MCCARCGEAKSLAVGDHNHTHRQEMMDFITANIPIAIKLCFMLNGKLGIKFARL